MGFLKNKFFSIGFLGLLIFIPAVLYFFSQYQKMYFNYQKTKILINKSSQVLGETSDKAIIDKVSKLMQLPSETPYVEKITSTSVFKNQPFFSNSQNGDMVLIYNNAKKIIIYREVINKIINVGGVATESASE